MQPLPPLNLPFVDSLPGIYQIGRIQCFTVGMLHVVPYYREYIYDMVHYGGTYSSVLPCWHCTHPALWGHSEASNWFINRCCENSCSSSPVLLKDLESHWSSIVQSSIVQSCREFGRQALCTVHSHNWSRNSAEMMALNNILQSLAKIFKEKGQNNST